MTTPVSSVGMPHVIGQPGERLPTVAPSNGMLPLNVAHRVGGFLVRHQAPSERPVLAIIDHRQHHGLAKTRSGQAIIQRIRMFNDHDH